MVVFATLGHAGWQADVINSDVDFDVTLPRVRVGGHCLHV